MCFIWSAQILFSSVDGPCLVEESALLGLQTKKQEVKAEIGTEAKKEAQKEMETCFGFDVSAHELRGEKRNLFQKNTIRYYLTP